jgi:hypothetical protein
VVGTESDCILSYLAAKFLDGLPLQFIVFVHGVVEGRLLRRIVTPISPTQKAEESTGTHEKSAVVHGSFAIPLIISHIEPLPLRLDRLNGMIKLRVDDSMGTLFRQHKL